MGIMTRFIRFCKADIHGVMDQLEDKGLLLKQHLRDMEEELSRKDSQLKGMAASREQLEHERERYEQECEKLDRDIESAIAKGRDDIARSLIRRLKSLTRHRDELRSHIQTLDRRIARMRDCAENQRRQYESVLLKSKEYLHRTEREQWEKTTPSFGAPCISREPSDEEIEIELLQRKTAGEGGGGK